VEFVEFEQYTCLPCCHEMNHNHKPLISINILGIDTFCMVTQKMQ